ncbi:MAG: hypothetical protein IKZ16_05595 [Clostridia bacterium]|nr:hypothetical protein [Clostridia bacterium]
MVQTAEESVAITVFFVHVFILLIIFEPKLRRIRGYGEFFRIPEKVTADVAVTEQPPLAEATDEQPPTESEPPAESDTPQE